MREEALAGERGRERESLETAFSHLCITERAMIAMNRYLSRPSLAFPKFPYFTPLAAAAEAG